MPSARMAPEGEFSLGLSFNDDYQQYAVSIQLFSWLESTVRYTRVPDTLYNPNPDYSGDNLYTDKGIDVKLRLWQEGYYLPEAAIGIRDIGGTGLFDGEYLAATKRFGPLDVTLGIGWGYLGQRGNITNPLCKVSDEFCHRDDGFSGSGGSVDAGRWFKGPAAIYGGLEYQTPHAPLRLKLEYDGNDYSDDFPVKRGKPLPQHTPWNAGLLYQANDFVDLRLSYQRGDTLTFGVNLFTNFNQMSANWRDTPKVAYQPVTDAPKNTNSLSQNADWQPVVNLLASNAGFQQSQLALLKADHASLEQPASGSAEKMGDTLVLTGEQKKYRDRQEGIDRAAAILTNHIGEMDNITTLRIIETRNGLVLTQTDIDVNAYRAYANHEYIGARFDDAVIASSAMQQPVADRALSKNVTLENDSIERALPNKRYAALNREAKDRASSGYKTATGEIDTVFGRKQERWNAGLSPSLQQSFGGPESFYLYSVGVNLNGHVWLTDSIEASGSIYVNLFDNYDKYNYVDQNPHIDNFSVPRVRTLFRAYVHDNPVRLSNLQLTWFGQPSENLFTQVYGGYLETMFAGVGGEVLYRQANSNWAFGIDWNLVSQRQVDSWLKTYREPFFYYDGYNANNCAPGNVSCQAYVLDEGHTGQASVYYLPKWQWLEGSRFQVSAGKFLGGDNGLRVDFAKRFDSGMIVGAYATKTDLTTEEYGEGSYNKGFYVSIPFDMLTIKPSVNRGTIAWQPITRDGGQTLNRKYKLFDVTNARYVWY
ncbi:YjbH domain-containing protein [Vibrio agarilyticus]